MQDNYIGVCLGKKLRLTVILLNRLKTKFIKNLLIHINPIKNNTCPRKSKEKIQLKVGVVIRKNNNNYDNIELKENDHRILLIQFKFKY